MAIEFFKKEGRGFLPKVSIRGLGAIGLNRAAVERFKIENKKDILLGFDREKRMVVIKLIDNPEPGSKKIIVRGKNGSISARGFCDNFDISYKETKSYPLEWDNENKFLLFYLEQENPSKNFRKV